MTFKVALQNKEEFFQAMKFFLSLVGKAVGDSYVTKVSRDEDGISVELIQDVPPPNPWWKNPKN